MNNDLQNKLQQFSPDPPAEAWDKIASALDAEESFAPRLYAYEETPPASNWQKIEQQALTVEKEAKIVPLHRRLSKPIRYIAAASIIAIILVTVTLTTERTEAGALETEGTTAVPSANIPVTAGTDPTGNENNSGQQFNTNESATDDNNQNSLAGSQTQRPTSLTGKRSFSTVPINALQSNYVTYSDGNGKVMRVSRKMETYINCQDSDRQCKQRLKELRQKMAAKAMTTDFTGILEMLQQLQ
ncbi:hypothetical protein HRH25_04840 [Flavisolibacter sp. BT320]|nr:hypothetical protein [Flavisolibacter longurius]